MCSKITLGPLPKPSKDKEEDEVEEDKEEDDEVEEDEEEDKEEEEEEEEEGAGGARPARAGVVGDGDASSDAASVMSADLGLGDVLPPDVEVAGVTVEELLSSAPGGGAGPGSVPKGTTTQPGGVALHFQPPGGRGKLHPKPAAASPARPRASPSQQARVHGADKGVDVDGV